MINYVFTFKVKMTFLLLVIFIPIENKNRVTHRLDKEMIVGILVKTTISISRRPFGVILKANNESCPKLNK